MSISQTYQYMQYQIADELGDRGDLLTPLADLSSVLTLGPIPQAIQAAIAFWEREPFYFNEFLVDYFNRGTSDWVTSLDQEYYGDTTTPNAWSKPAKVSTLAGINKAWLFVNNQRYPLTWRGMDYMVDTSVNPSVTGWPTDMGYCNGMLRFYPIPNGAYPIFAHGTQRLSALVDPTDSNAWTSDAYDLIRSTAKMILYEETLQDADGAAVCRRVIYGEPDMPGREGYLTMLRKETTRRRGRGRIRPSYF